MTQVAALPLCLILTGAELPREKKSVLHLCMQGCFSHVQVCDPVDCGLSGFSVKGFSRQEYWSGFPYPCRELYFLLL